MSKVDDRVARRVNRYGAEVGLDGGGTPGRATVTSRMPPSARSIARAVMAEMRGPAASAEAAVARADGGGGQPLPSELRARFETSLGTDLGGVRVHTDAAAGAAADALGARAYASDQDVFMGASRYRPDTADGALLIAHEVAHTVQQRGTPGAPQMKLDVSTPGDAAEVEADDAAAAMVTGAPASVSSHAPALRRWVDTAAAAPARRYVGQASADQLPTIISQLEQMMANPPAGPVISEPIALGLAAFTSEHGGVSGDFHGNINPDDVHDLYAEAVARFHAAAPQRPPAAGQPAPAQGGEDTPASNDGGTGNPNIRVAPVGVQGHDDHPAPSGIEGSPAQPRLDALLTVVRGELTAWTTWRGSFRGARPGPRAYAAARALEHDLPSLAGNPDYDPDAIRQQSLYDPRVRAYLIAHLGQENLPFLTEMISFNPVGDAVLLGELFDRQILTVHHHYRIEMRGWSARAGAALNASFSSREMIVTYTNDIGDMRYEHRMRGRNLNLGAAGGAEVTEHGVHASGAGASIEREMTSSDAENDSLNFWPPDSFNGGYMIGSAGASVGGGVPGANRAGGSVGASMVMLTFYWNGLSMPFQFADTGATVGADSSRRHPTIGASGNLDVGAGIASDEGTEGHAGGAPTVRTDEMTELVTASVLFPTQSAQLDATGNQTIADALQLIRTFLTTYPDAHLATTVTGYASPRWRGAASADEASAHNLQLSNDRTNNTLSQLRNAITAIANGGHCDFRTTTCPSPALGTQDPHAVDASWRGSVAAQDAGVGAGEDPQAWRRVDIQILRSVYRSAAAGSQAAH